MCVVTFGYDENCVFPESRVRGGNAYLGIASLKMFDDSEV